MSYSANERLPEDCFRGVMEEKAEILRKYLNAIGNLWCTHPIVDIQWQLLNFTCMMKKTLSDYITPFLIWET